MQTTQLPESVTKALGPEAASDLLTWLEEKLGQTAVSTEIQISPFTARQKVNVLMLERVSNLLPANLPLPKG